MLLKKRFIYNRYLRKRYYFDLEKGKIVYKRLSEIEKHLGPCTLCHMVTKKECERRCSLVYIKIYSRELSLYSICESLKHKYYIEHVV